MSNETTYTVAELLAEPIRVNAEACRAIRAYRRAKPWRGSFKERLAKMQTFRDAMAAAYGVNPKLTFRGRELGDRSMPGNGGATPDGKMIVMVGRLSVVTFLHCFCRARGMNHREACRWSLGVFKRFFPLSFSRCRQVGFMLIRGSGAESPAGEPAEAEPAGDGPALRFDDAASDWICSACGLVSDHCRCQR